MSKSEQGKKEDKGQSVKKDTGKPKKKDSFGSIITKISKVKPPEKSQKK